MTQAEPSGVPPSSTVMPPNQEPTASTAKPLSLQDRIVLLVAIGFGAGWSPYAPGTVGTAVGLPLAWGLSHTGIEISGWSLVCIALFLLGVPICTKAARLLGTEDPGSVVFDEIAAVPLVFLLVPVTPWSLCLGFLWFRLFDVLKPWPIRRFERLPAGWGIMADDTVAALFAAGCLRLTYELLIRLAN